MQTRIKPIIRAFLEDLGNQNKSVVVGYTAYQGDGFNLSFPVSIQSILDEKLDRNFIPCIQQALNEFFNAENLDKQACIPYLIDKYLTGPGPVNIQPNPNGPDFNLHQYYLQPYLPYGIQAQQRKIHSDLRQWHWGPENNAAPLFQSIIKALVLNRLIQEVQANDEKERLEGMRDQSLKQISDTCREITQGSFQDRLIEPTRGLVSERLSQYLMTHFRGSVEALRQFAAGRLLFGQPQLEPRTLAALDSSRTNTSPFKKVFHFLSTFIYHHLNLRTNLYWLKSIGYLIKALHIRLKEYTIHRTRSFSHFCFESLCFIPLFFILLSFPILMLIPSVLGLTSLPFTGLRYLLLHHAPRFFQKPAWGMLVNLLEFIKDGYLLITFALPVLNTLFIGAAALLPNSLLTIGAIMSTGIAFAVLTFTFAALVGTLEPLQSGTLFKLCAAIPQMPFMQLIGVTSLLGMGAYVAIGASMRALNPLISEAVHGWLDRLFNATFGWILSIRQRPEPAQVLNIVPIEIQQQDLPWPLQSGPRIPQALRERVDQTLHQLGQLNTALHLSGPRKALIRKVMGQLEISPETSEAALQKSIETAEGYLQDNFTLDECQRLKALLAENECREDQMGMRISERQQTPFQPSWALVQRLRASDRFETLPASMQARLEHIETLKPTT